MKNIIIIALFITCTVYGQQDNTTSQNSVKVGDIFIIGAPSSSNYQSVFFPKNNFIIKKGGIPNYKRIRRTYVVTTSVTKDQEGSTKISLKRKDGKKFFNSITQIQAHLENALVQNELKLAR